VASILELLQKVQLIDDRGADAVMSRAKSRSGGHLVQQVAELGLATESNIARSISVELAMPRIDLHMTPPEPAALNLLDARTCVERFVLPIAVRESGGLLWLAMADPTDQESIAVVGRRTQKRVRPAVAAASEIVRAARECYGAPQAGAELQPEQPPAEKLAEIELDDTSAEEVELVDLMDDSASPLSRIARQLGKPMPARVAQRPDALEITDNSEPPIPAAVTHATPPRALPRIPPPTPAPPTKKTPPVQGTARVTRPGEPDLFAVTSGGPIEHDDLAPDDLSTLEALRQSLEKGAIVLRAIAELCVEKGVLTLKDMRRKRN